MPNWSKTFQTFSSHSFDFPLGKQPTNLNVQCFFTSNTTFGDYFQWNACTYFQKTCIWTRYSEFKLIKNISTFLVALLCFSFRRTTQKYKFSEFFLPLIDYLVATFSQTRGSTSRKYVSVQGIVNSNWSKPFQTFWLLSSVFPLKKEPKNLNFQSFFTSNRPFGGYFRWNACTYF